MVLIADSSTALADLIDPGPSVVRFERTDRIGVVTIDEPPLNILTRAVTTGLGEAVDQFEADATLDAMVICCAGRSFVAGGDLRAFDHPDFDPTPYNNTLARIELQSRPVVAALHGSTLGGGLELALACHYRIALAGTQLGFPEVNIGVLPGSLGTQRLPRLIPLKDALSMILSGEAIDAEQGLTLGLLDKVGISGEADAARKLGLAYARGLVQLGAKARPTRRLPVRTEELKDGLFDEQYGKLGSRQETSPASLAILEAVRAATTLDFDEAGKLEAKLFDTCRRSRQSRALRHLFFAEREVWRMPGISPATHLRPIRKVGIVGAGTMGSGIAMSFINAGFQTVLLDTDLAGLERGKMYVEKQYEANVATGRLTKDGMRQRMENLTASLDYQDLADCDMVIEAVFEDMRLKKEVMRCLDSICRPGAILATNTSTLDVDIIAQSTSRVSDVIGTHFFSPANIMRLLEVVRGTDTSPDVLMTVLDLARRIGKIAVVSGVCYGFIGNRMAEPYMRENEFLLLEGATPAQIDRAIENPALVGMAMGPCRMLDMAGIDVGAKTLIELSKTGGLPEDPSYRAVCQRLHRDGRFGQKTGSGYYRYEGRIPRSEPKTQSVCAELAATLGIVRRYDLTPGEITERLVLSLINEAARILDEGIALRPGDIDVVWTAGYGFPKHRGGPLWMADEMGLSHVVERLHHYAEKTQDAFGYWSPAPLLNSLAKRGDRISDYRKDTEA